MSPVARGCKVTSVLQLIVVAVPRAMSQSQYWTVTTGFCQVDSRGCITSPNYPFRYDVGSSCTITVSPSDWTDKAIAVDHFVTEGCCDKLTVNGISYSGSVGPEGIRPSGVITWITDIIGGVDTGWKLCPSESSASSESEAEDEVSVGAIIGIVIGIVFILALAVVLFVCWRKSRRKAEWASVEPALAAPERPHSMPAPAPAPAALGNSATAPETERGESSPANASKIMIQVNRTPVVVPPAEAAVPRFWKNTTGRTFDELVEASAEEVALITDMVKSTFIQDVVTRDRTGVMSNGLKPVRVLRMENNVVWEKYTQGRSFIRQKRPHKCTESHKYGSVIMTMQEGSKLTRLSHTVNEVYLWHGTSPQKALNICKAGFSLRYAGTGAGSMYGNGAYLAESSSKSDEYAQDDGTGLYKGLFCLLLCRVVLGEMLHLTTGGEKTHDMIKNAIESDVYDSVIGDRKISVGTYREFVVYGEDQVYPEYIVLYERVM